MLADERLELADQRCVATQSKIDIDSLLLTSAAKLFEAGDLALREGLVEEVKKGRAAPERKSFTQSRRSAGSIPTHEGLAALAKEAFEPVTVELVGFNPDRVPGGHGENPVAVTESSSEPLDGRLKSVWRVFRRVRGPQVLDQTISRNNLVRVNQELREERPRLAPTQLHRALGTNHLKRPKDSELHPMLASHLPPHCQRPHPFLLLTAQDDSECSTGRQECAKRTATTRTGASEKQRESGARYRARTQSFRRPGAWPSVPRLAFPHATR